MSKSCAQSELLSNEWLPNAPILFTAYAHKVYHEQLLTAKNGQATVQLTAPSDTPNLRLDVVMVKDRQLRRHQRLLLTGTYPILPADFVCAVLSFHT